MRCDDAVVHNSPPPGASTLSTERCPPVLSIVEGLNAVPYVEPLLFHVKHFVFSFSVSCAITNYQLRTKNFAPSAATRASAASCSISMPLSVSRETFF